MVAERAQVQKLATSIVYQNIHQHGIQYYYVYN